ASALATQELTARLQTFIGFRAHFFELFFLDLPLSLIEARNQAFKIGDSEPGSKARKYMRDRKLVLALMLTCCLAAGPAMPQADINPDHFPDGPAVQVDSSGLNHQQARTEHQSQFDQLIIQIGNQRQAVEEANQDAISAGIVGDGAGPYIDAYKTEVERLE